MKAQSNHYLIFFHRFSQSSSLTSIFNCYYSSPWGSCCQFLPVVIIASLVSSCNGHMLSNPDHGPVLGEWLTITSLITPLSSLPPLRLSFLNLSMPSSNFLTAIFCCFLPLGSQDCMQHKVGPWWVIPLLAGGQCCVFILLLYFILFLRLLQVCAFMKWNLNSVSGETNNKKVEIVRWHICLDTESYDST